MAPEPIKEPNAMEIGPQKPARIIEPAVNPVPQRERTKPDVRPLTAPTPRPARQPSRKPPVPTRVPAR